MLSAIWGSRIPAALVSTASPAWSDSTSVSMGRKASPPLRPGTRLVSSARWSSPQNILTSGSWCRACKAARRTCCGHAFEVQKLQILDDNGCNSLSVTGQSSPYHYPYPPTPHMLESIPRMEKVEENIRHLSFLKLKTQL